MSTQIHILFIKKNKMNSLNKSPKYKILFWIILWCIITITISTIRQSNKIISIFYLYNKIANTDKNYINQYHIEWWKQSPISGEIQTSHEQVIRVEFPYTTVKNKILSLSLKWSGTIQWYMASKKPILNCNTWIINERGGCSNSYWTFNNIKNIYGIFKKSRLVRQPIVNIENKQISLFKDSKILSTIDSELWNYSEYSISSFIFSYMKKHTNMERHFPTMDSPNGYSIIYLKTDEKNNITFAPYDLSSNINHVWYIITLSWWSSIKYTFTENPLSTIDNEWLKN